MLRYVPRARLDRVFRSYGDSYRGQSGSGMRAYPVPQLFFMTTIRLPENSYYFFKTVNAV